VTLPTDPRLRRGQNLNSEWVTTQGGLRLRHSVAGSPSAMVKARHRRPVRTSRQRCEWFLNIATRSAARPALPPQTRARRRPRGLASGVMADRPRRRGWKGCWWCPFGAVEVQKERRDPGVPVCPCARSISAGSKWSRSGRRLGSSVSGPYTLLDATPLPVASAW